MIRRLDDPYYRISPELNSGYLPVIDGHSVYWEESGNPEGLPIVLVHGGPGGSNSAGYRAFIDSERFRIIQFDQRGCGRSEPKGLLASNSLQSTLADMELLRQHFDIERWIVAGGSWGSTVALAYGEAYPQRCLGLLLISLWLCRKQDIHWWYQGLETIFPELWQQFAAEVPASERHDLCGAYSRRILQGEDQTLADKLATQLYLYEEGFMRLDAPLTPPDLVNAATYGRIFSHFSSKGFFLRENQLLEEAHRIADLPVVLISGRYDMCTPPNNAYALRQQLHNAELTIVPGAGHNPTELALARVLVQGCSKLIARMDLSNCEV